MDGLFKAHAKTKFLRGITKRMIQAVWYLCNSSVTFMPQCMGRGGS